MKKIEREQLKSYETINIYWTDYVQDGIESYITRTIFTRGATTL